MSFLILSFITVYLWQILYTWFPLSKHDTTPYFFFKNIGQQAPPVATDTLLIFLLLILIYLANYLLLNKKSSLSFFVKVIFFSGVLGSIIFAILLYPIGSRDFFNYLINIKLTYFYHMNPYIDSYPTHAGDVFAKFGFSLFIPLFYGPAWLFISGLPALFANFTNFFYTALIFKLFNALLILSTGLIIYLYQDLKKNKFLALYLFLTNPFILFDGIANSHNDIMMAFFLVLTLFSLKKRSILVFSFFITAVLTKFFVIVLTPLVIGIMIRKKMAPGKIVASFALSLIIVFIYTIPFWHNGALIKGLLQGMQMSQNFYMDQSSLFSFMREYFISKHIADTGFFSPRIINTLAFLLTGIAVFILWIKRKIIDEIAMQDTFILFLLFVSLLYPWYMLPAIALMTLNYKKNNIVFLFYFTIIYFLYLPASDLLLNEGYKNFALEIIQTTLLSGAIVLYFIAKILLSLRIKLPFNLSGLKKSG